MENIMDRDKPFTISLTGKDSHTIKVQSGQGSFSIGDMEMDEKKFDILVDKDEPINWECFNDFSTPASYPWPRFLYYWGNDSGFNQWSEKRQIEDFTWCPLKPVSVDFSGAQIGRLTLVIKNHNINLQLGKGIETFIADGTMENITVGKAPNTSTLFLYPNTKNDSTMYQLPLFTAFEYITSLTLKVNPLGQPFDCERLLQFKALTNLSIGGNLTNLQCLKNFKNLTHLRISTAPNLENFPPLHSWEHLKSFFASDIEKTTGKLLRTELNKLKKESTLGYSSVSGLRKPIWFMTEYGIPFSIWKGNNAKIAMRNYKAALKKLKKATDEKEIRNLIVEFTIAFNPLEQIETIEREDIATAVCQLIQIPKISIGEKTALQWFDSVRDY